MPKKNQPILFEGPTFSHALERLIEEFIEHRTEVKKPMTPRAIKMFRELIANTLKDLYTEDEVAKMITNAIIQRWLTIWPKPLSHQEKRARWCQTPHLFYDYLTEQERETYNNLFFS